MRRKKIKGTPRICLFWLFLFTHTTLSRPAGEPSNESHKDKVWEGLDRDVSGSEPRSGLFSRGALSVLCGRGHFWRVGTVLFGVRGTSGVGRVFASRGRTKLI